MWPPVISGSSSSWWHRQGARETSHQPSTSSGRSRFDRSLSYRFCASRERCGVEAIRDGDAVQIGSLCHSRRPVRAEWQRGGASAPRRPRRRDQDRPPQGQPSTSPKPRIARYIASTSQRAGGSKSTSRTECPTGKTGMGTE